MMNFVPNVSPRFRSSKGEEEKDFEKDRSHLDDER